MRASATIEKERGDDETSATDDGGEAETAVEDEEDEETVKRRQIEEQVRHEEEEEQARLNQMLADEQLEYLQTQVKQLMAVNYELKTKLNENTVQTQILKSYLTKEVVQSGLGNP